MKPNARLCYATAKFPIPEYCLLIPEYCLLIPEYCLLTPEYCLLTPVS